MGVILDSLQQKAEPVHVVGDGKHIRQDFILGADDEAIVLIFRDVDANRNYHNKYLQRKCDAASTVRLTFVALFHINRPAVFN